MLTPSHCLMSVGERATAGVAQGSLSSLAALPPGSEWGGTSRWSARTLRYYGANPRLWKSWKSRRAGVRALQCNTVNACYFGKYFATRRRAEQRSASAERCSALQIQLRLRRAALHVPDARQLDSHRTMKRRGVACGRPNGGQFGPAVGRHEARPYDCVVAEMPTAATSKPA